MMGLGKGLWAVGQGPGEWERKKSTMLCHNTKSLTLL